MKNHQGKKVNREEEHFIQDLKARNDALQKENKAMQGKLKNASLTLQKYKQQLQSMRIRYGASPPVRSKSCREATDDGCKMTVDSTCNSTNQYDEDVNMVLSKLQARLHESDCTIKSLKSENEQLKAIKAEMERHIEQNSVNQDERNDEVSGTVHYFMNLNGTTT